MVAQECVFDEPGDVFVLVGGEVVDGFGFESQGRVLGVAFVVEEE